MINTLSLLTGLAGILFVTVRALIADRTLPWFKPAPLKPPEPPKKRWGQAR